MGDEIVCWSEGDDLLSTISDDLLSTMSDNTVHVHHTMTWDPLAGAVYENSVPSGSGESEALSTTELDAPANLRTSCVSSHPPVLSSTQRRSYSSRNGKNSALFQQVKAATVGGCPGPAPLTGNPSVPLKLEVFSRSSSNRDATECSTSHDGDWSRPGSSEIDSQEPIWLPGRTSGFSESSSSVSGQRGDNLGGQGEVRAGWLLKKAESSWGWRRRWFILYPGRLTYQATPDGTGVVKTIPLHDPRPGLSGGRKVDTATVEALSQDLEFRLHSFGRSFQLKAMSSRDRNHWVDALQKVLLSLEAHSAASPALPAVPRNASPGWSASSAGASSASQLKRKLAETPGGVGAAGLYADGGGTVADWDSEAGRRSGDGSLSESEASWASGRATLPRTSGELAARGGGDGWMPGTNWPPADDGVGGGRSSGEEGKRVRVRAEVAAGDPPRPTDPLFAAGQQAVELAMRYLAHSLMGRAAPSYPVHEVIFSAWQAFETLRRGRGAAGLWGVEGRLTSQFLTSVVLRGLLVKQQIGPDSWPEVTVSQEDAPYCRMSQHVTQRIVGSVGRHIATAAEAAVLPPILLPLLAIIELCHKHGWPRQCGEEERRAAMHRTLVQLSRPPADILEAPGDADPPPPQACNLGRPRAFWNGPAGPAAGGGGGEAPHASSWSRRRASGHAAGAAAAAAEGWVGGDGVVGS